MMFRRLVFLIFMISLAIAGNSFAGLLAVSGDATMSFSLTDAEPNEAYPGNQQLFLNILGAGSNVAVLGTLNSAAGEEIHDFYSSLPGSSSTLIYGALTSSNLLGLDLLVMPTPDDLFTSSEILAMNSLLSAGGSIFFLGESTIVPFGVDSNTAINTALSDLGFGVELEMAGLDMGLRPTGPGQIGVDPLTAGIVDLEYGATTSVTGGVSVLSTTTGESMMSYFTVIPEPESPLLILIGLVFLGILSRSRQVRRIH